MPAGKKLPNKIVKRQSVLVELTAREVEQALERRHGLTDESKAEIRTILKNHLGELEYFVLVKPDGYGEIHTNHLREAVYFTDPVGLKCAAVVKTEAFFYPRNTGEQLVDVSTPVYYQGQKVYALRSGTILKGLSRELKVGVPFGVLQLAGIIDAAVTKNYWSAGLMLVAGAIVINEGFQFRRFYRQTIQFMRTMASGELNGQLHPKARDEWGQLHFELNKVSIGIVSIIKRIHSAALSVNEGVEESSSALNEIYAGAEELGAGVEEIGTGASKQNVLLANSTGELENIAGKMNRIDQEVTSSQSLLIGIDSLVTDAGRSMINIEQHMVDTVNVMNQFAENFNQLLQQVDQIKAWAMEIGEISNQTRMLSLNASIEAARAGEYGKGFSVVAEEIGKLSDETDELTNRVRDAVQELSAFMSSTSATATKQENSIRISQESFRKLNSEVGNVKGSIDTLKEQMDKTRWQVKETQQFRDEILSNVGEILKITSQFALQVDGIRGASKHQTEQLLSISEAVHRLTGVFKALSDELERFHVN